MKYQMLKQQAKDSMVAARIEELERQHYQLSLNLQLAEGQMEKGIEGAEADVIGATEQMALVEFSLKTLGKL